MIESVPPPARRILLVDCDMFFVQVARLEDPEGAGRKPLLLVGGSPSGRGVVTSASYEVRAFGVRSGMPTAQALRLCPEATAVPVSRTGCARKSRAVNDTLRRIAPVVQAASIDEFYLDLSGTERLFAENLTATAQRIRERVLADTDISVSVGGGTSRVIAKLAVRRAKPGGVLVVPAGQERGFMRAHHLAELPGVGPAFAEQLRRRGLVRVEDAIRVERAWLRAWLGEGRGDWLYERMRGIDSSAVLAREPRKSVSSERTFARDLKGDRTVERELLRLCVSATAALRRADLRTRTVTVKLRDSDFTTRQSGHFPARPGRDRPRRVRGRAPPAARAPATTPHAGAVAGGGSVRTHRTGHAGPAGAFPKLRPSGVGSRTGRWPGWWTTCATGSAVAPCCRDGSWSGSRKAAAVPGAHEPHEELAFLPAPHDLRDQPGHGRRVGQPRGIHEQLGKGRSALTLVLELVLQLPYVATVGSLLRATLLTQVGRIQEDLTTGGQRSGQGAQQGSQPRERPRRRGPVHEREHRVVRAVGPKGPEIPELGVPHATRPHYGDRSGEDLERRDLVAGRLEGERQRTGSGADVEHPAPAQSEGRPIGG